jgi:hypothetical protein
VNSNPFYVIRRRVNLLRVFEKKGQPVAYMMAIEIEVKLK